MSDTPTTEQARVLAGLRDAPLVQRRPRPGTGRVDFTRDAPDTVGAVVSAFADIEAAGLDPVRLVHDDWVTLAAIAARLRRSRETVRRWTTGDLGPGGFPPPVNPGQDTSFYSWVEVTGWVRTRLGIVVATPDPAYVAADLALRLRHVGALVPEPGRLYQLLVTGVTASVPS